MLLLHRMMQNTLMLTKVFLIILSFSASARSQQESSSNMVKIRLHTKNQLPRLPGTALNVMAPWCGLAVVVVVVFLTDNITIPTKVVLSCFGLLVGLWQVSQFIECYSNVPKKLQPCKVGGVPG